VLFTVLDDTVDEVLVKIFVASDHMIDDEPVG
jgi:hypothetical protein